MAVSQNTTLPLATDPTAQQKPPLPGATGNPAAPVQNALPVASPMTPPAASPVPLPTTASPLAPTPTGAGAYDRPGGTFTPQDPNVVTAGAANNPIGNAAFQWVTDPLTGAFVKSGQQNVQQANGSFLDGAGVSTDPAGTTRTDYFDGGSGNPGMAPPSTIQRPGGPLTATPGSSMPVAGQFGGAPASPTPLLGASPSASPSSSAPPPLATGNPSSGAPTSLPSSAPAALPVASPQTSTTGPGGIGLSNTDLTGSTISAGPTANRQQIVQDQIKNYASGLLPDLQAQIRAKTQQAAGMGRIGSGMLRTDVGNLDLAAENALNQKFSDLTSGAASGSIGDAQEAARLATQQQGFQAGQQNTAFNQGAQEIALQEALTSGDFNRYMQLLNAGNTGNPSDTALALSNNYGNQAGQAGQALTGLVSNSTANANSGLPAWLQALLKGGQGAVPGTALPPGGDGGGQS